jgi:hypothetical protein
MITTRQFSSAIHEECRIVIHIAGKVSLAGMDYRPSGSQRSTIELLRYLTTCAIVPATFAVTSEWSHRAPLEAQSSKLRPADIPAAMQDQATRLDELIRPFSGQEWYERSAPLPWGVATTLGDALVLTALRGLVAYRMQLFLYAKASGATALNTMDCWLGMDSPGPARP